jgi:hypothetical protein
MSIRHMVIMASIARFAAARSGSFNSHLANGTVLRAVQVWTARGTTTAWWYPGC